MKRCVVLGLVLFAVSAASASAQTTGVVTVDQATIWRTDAAVVLATVKAGTMVEVVAQSGGWYEVVVPRSIGGRGEHGLIATTQVKLAAGATPPTARAVIRPTAPAQTSAAAPARQGGTSFRAFGQVGLMTFAANQSFDAILGKSRGPVFGGGAQVVSAGGFYLQGSFDRFRKNGQRVFVFEEEVFPLGIPSTITIMPIMVSAGYRASGRAIAPYGGAGAGVYLLKETSRFDADGEAVDEKHAAYQVFGGVEFGLTRWLATAAEAQYTRVPDALGSTGVSASFDEHDLGGFQAQFKVLVGR